MKRILLLFVLCLLFPFELNAANLTYHYYTCYKDGYWHYYYVKGTNVTGNPPNNGTESGFPIVEGNYIFLGVKSFSNTAPTLVFNALSASGAIVDYRCDITTYGYNSNYVSVILSRVERDSITNIQDYMVNIF
jgi:hypothetical protein